MSVKFWALYQLSVYNLAQYIVTGEENKIEDRFKFVCYVIKVCSNKQGTWKCGHSP